MRSDAVDENDGTVRQFLLGKPQSARVVAMRYQDIITIEPGKRGGKPCIRGMRITIYFIFSYLAAG